MCCVHLAPAFFCGSGRGSLCDVGLLSRLHWRGAVRLPTEELSDEGSTRSAWKPTTRPAAEPPHLHTPTRTKDCLCCMWKPST
eukprot:s6272_g8.t1